MAQELTADIETDAFDADSLEELKAEMPNTCNGFAFAYAEANENAVVKDAFVDTSNSGAHCFVYDGDLDATIDVTLGQFNGCPDVGAWDGDRHPHTCDFEETFEWESRGAFEDHYGSMPEHDNPFYV